MKRVLLADDDRDILEGLRIALSETYEVVAVADGRAVIERLAESSFDAVVLDFMMPQMTGEDVLRALAASPGHPPVLVISARHDASERSRALGARDFLGKPFGFDTLLKRLDRMLGGGASGPTRGGPIGGGGSGSGSPGGGGFSRVEPIPPAGGVAGRAGPVQARRASPGDARPA